MRKVVLIFAMVAFVTTACQSGGNQVSSTTEKTSVSEQPSPDELVKRVEDIYATVFKCYIHEDSLRNLDKLEGSPVWENRDRFNSEYCSRGFNDLLRQVNEIDSLYHGDELGFFEADYWIMGQDWGSDLHISDVKVVSISAEEAVVEMKIHNFGTDKPVRLKMVNDNGQWMIDSFVDENFNYDLKKEMEEYVLNETKENKN